MPLTTSGLTRALLYDTLCIPLEGKALPPLLQGINWIDIIFVILLLGMVYKGSSTGVGGQVPSLIGFLALIFFSTRYYNYLSQAIFGFLLQRWAKPLSFFSISIIIFMIVKIAERILHVISGEELSPIEKIGGIIIASIRASLLYGIIGMLLLLVPVDSLRTSVSEGSNTCMFFVKLDAGLYTWMSGFVDSKEKNRKKVIEEFLEATKTK